MSVTFFFNRISCYVLAVFAVALLLQLCIHWIRFSKLAFFKNKTRPKQNDELEPVSVVVGDQWEATFCENYMPGRPPACPLTDPVSIRLHRDLIREKGALLIGSPEEFTDFLREFGHPEIEFTEFRIEFQTRIGKDEKPFKVIKFKSMTDE